jgi:RimJ/RimL family protein N-acetyltransferase
MKSGLKSFPAARTAGSAPEAARGGSPTVLGAALLGFFLTAGLDRLEAMHHPDNPASGRVLTKAGFTHIGTADRQTDDGTTVPYQVYALR